MVEKRGKSLWFSHTIMILGVLVVFFPIWLAFVASTVTQPEIVQPPMPLWPGDQFLNNYHEALVSGVNIPVATMLLNSLIMAMGIAVGKIVISLLSAFAIVYFKFPGKMIFFWLIFMTLMLPVEVRIVPTYEVIAGFGMLNSYSGLILPLIASATATFLFRQFFMTVPDELAEAARVDGASPMRFFWDILFPMSRTNIAALFVILFIYGWNQYLWPLLITTDPSMNTIVMGIKQMFPSGDDVANWPVIMATSILAMIPPVIVVISMQKLFIRGLVDSEKIGGPMATVELNAVKKRFGSIEVIHGITTTIADGEFIVIVGPSGCGKSTLLRMVAGLETVSEGEVKISGNCVNELEPMDRDIAMVFQNYALYPHMSVSENMGYGLKIAKLPKATINEKVQAAAKLLQLEDFLDRRPRDLSGGQRQRVAMGRAIVREPAVFLFDEPLSNLDAKLRVQMRLEIRDLQNRLGITSLYVTHDQVEAMTMADRMIVMNMGRAEQIGTPLEVYERPQTLFAAQFIGSPSMNVLDGSVENGILKIAGTTVAEDLTITGSVTIGIRPEHIIPDADGPLSMAVQMGEPLGANTLLHGRLLSSRDAFTVSLTGVHHTVTGDIIRFGFDPKNLHFFDPQTSERLPD